MLASTAGEGGEGGNIGFSRTSYTVEKYDYLPSISGAVESKLLPMRRSTQIATSSQCSTNSIYTYFYQQKTCACVCTYTSTYFSLPQNLFDSLDRCGSGHAQLVRHILQHSLHTMYIYIAKKDSVNITNNNTSRIFPFGCGTHTSLLHGKCPTFQFKSV